MLGGGPVHKCLCPGHESGADTVLSVCILRRSVRDVETRRSLVGYLLQDQGHDAASAIPEDPSPKSQTLVQDESDLQGQNLLNLIRKAGR